MRHSLLLLAAIALATSASAADTPPRWRHKPTEQDLLAVWPSAALKQGLGGKAVITCKVAVQGTLYDCTVDSETPAGAGFGGAAIALTPQFLMTPKLHDGVPVVGGEVTIPVNFPAPNPNVGSHLHGDDSDFGSVRVISGVPWIEAPTYADVVAAYPKKAREGAMGGRAVLDCHFDGQGRLSHCDVIDEDPKGYGFGAAAKGLAPKFLAPRQDGAGVSLKAATTQIPFTFDPSMLTGGQPVIGKPHWARLPEGDAVAAGFPKAARAAHVDTGAVTLSCAVGLAGRLGDCQVVKQEPPGLDFDKAALALSGDFQVSVWTSEGLPTVGGRVRIPLRYQMADDPPPATPKP